MASSREKYSQLELRVMINHIYKLCTSTHKEDKKIAACPKGKAMWDMLFLKQRRIHSPAKVNHSAQSMNSKFRKYLHTNMHKVMGVDPAKVLFIYQFYKTPIPYAEQIHMKGAFHDYDIVINNNSKIVQSYKRKANAPRRTDVDSDENESEEEEEEEEDDRDEEEREEEERNDGNEEEEEDEEIGGAETMLHVSQDSDYEDPDRVDRMNLSPVLRTPGGTRRAEIDPSSTPHIDKLKRRVALFYGNSKFPDELLTDTPDTRGNPLATRAAAADVRISPMGIPSPPGLTPPPQKRARQHQPTFAVPAAPAAARISSSGGVIMPRDSPAVLRLREERSKNKEKRREEERERRDESVIVIAEKKNQKQSSIPSAVGASTSRKTTVAGEKAPQHSSIPSAAAGSGGKTTVAGEKDPKQSSIPSAASASSFSTTGSSAGLQAEERLQQLRTLMKGVDERSAEEVGRELAILLGASLPSSTATAVVESFLKTTKQMAESNCAAVAFVDDEVSLPKDAAGAAAGDDQTGKEKEGGEREKGAEEEEEQPVRFVPCNNPVTAETLVKLVQLEDVYGSVMELVGRRCDAVKFVMKEIEDISNADPDEEIVNLLLSCVQKSVDKSMEDDELFRDRDEKPARDRVSSK